MNTNKVAFISFLIIALVMGCSRDYGTIRKQSGAENKMTLAELKQNWDEYTVYKSYRWATIPAAIMFDPKDNDKMLVGDSWYLIQDQETLAQSIREIQEQYDYAGVAIIEGPDNQVFGYMYYPDFLQVTVRMIDARILYVGRLPASDCQIGDQLHDYECFR